MYDCISAGYFVYWRKNLSKKFKDGTELGILCFLKDISPKRMMPFFCLERYSVTRRLHSLVRYVPESIEKKQVE